MKFIIGLGNIGAKYDDTRHNAGFMVLDDYVNANNLGNWQDKPRFKAHIIQTGQTFFIKPTTYMNLSGQTIAMGMAFYKVAPDDILIIHDDKDIDFGTVRIRQGGSSGGHNGIKSLPESVQDDAWRLRIGVGNSLMAKMDTADFVLSKFTKEELEEFDSISTTCQQQIDNFINDTLFAQTLTN